MKRVISLNAGGLRVGESHQRAKLTDHEVDQIRELHESGIGYRRLSRMFEVDKRTIARIVRCELRAQTIVAFKTVALPDE